MKRILMTITLIMAFGLTAYAGHDTNARLAGDGSARERCLPGHDGVALKGHAD